MKKRLFIGLIITSLLSLASLVSFSTPDPVDAATYVKSYFRKDGTFVRSHFRSNPDHSFLNNYSTYGNINPFTGERGTKLFPGSYNGITNDSYSGTGYNDYPYNYENKKINIQIERKKLSKEEFKANNIEYYEFQKATEDDYKMFLISAENTIKNQSIDRDLSNILEEFKTEVEDHKVEGQYEFAREGLIEEIGLIQSHIQSESTDFEELNLQIKSIKLNYQDVVSVLDRIDDTK